MVGHNVGATLRCGQRYGGTSVGKIGSWVHITVMHVVGRVTYQVCEYVTSVHRGASSAGLQRPLVAARPSLQTLAAITHHKGGEPNPDHTESKVYSHK